MKLIQPILKPINPPRGFALIVTLSLLVLLTVVAVGLLSLSSISIRAAGRASDQSIARANARLALMLAIGELQKQTGLDTRVTARADILVKTNPPVLGAWKSWEGTDHETSGDYAGRPVSLGTDYKSVKAGRFLRWLVSGDPAGLANSANLPSTTKSASTVPLVGGNSVDPSKPELQIHLTPTQLAVGTQKASFAWWVGGENQKARLPKPPVKAPTSAADWAAFAKSDTTADPVTFGMDKLSDPTLANKATDIKQVDLLDPSANSSGALKTSTKYFHDLSAVSVGLLTNTATGGWRKDLSLFTENYNSLATSGLPLFRLLPDTDNSCSIPQGSAANYRAPKSIFYPWSAYRGAVTDRSIYQQGAVASWENLKDYALLYQNQNPFVFSARSVQNNSAVPAVSYNFIHKVRLLPIIARVQWVFSHYASPALSPPNPPNSYTPQLLVTPVITLWNPYNVTLNCTGGFTFNIPKPLPCVLKYTVNGTAYTKYRSLTSGSTNYTEDALSKPTNKLSYKIDSITPGPTISLAPGQTRVYSPSATAVAASNSALPITPGFRKTGGHYFTLYDDAAKALVVPGSATIKASAKFDNAYNDAAIGVGIYLDMLSIADANNEHLVYRMVYDPVVAAQTYPEISNLSESKALSSEASNPTAFLSTMFGARLASNTYIPAKGFLQTSPFVNFTAMGGKDVAERTIMHHYAGTGHPVNSPFDYSFVAHTGIDSYLPNLTGESGYIVTGFTTGNGLSRCIAAEVPTRPLASLAELQHWDLRYENPIPPYSFNLIGNSNATPLLPENAVVNSADSAITTNLQHDDSYCANHLLFDDWFLSSIAAGNPIDFGMTGSSSLQTNFMNFENGTVPLINRCYKPLPEDAAAANGGATSTTDLYNKYVNNANAWKNIASHLEVEGMFNVNSTSVTAWRALLGHAYKQKTPYTNGSSSVTLSSEGNYPISRMSIAGDSKAGTAGASGGFSGATEFAGYRQLDGTQLDAFAQLIVDQVRLRGPFLSLSEFVNRQLSSGNLALAGAIESALNEMAKNNSTNFYANLIAGLDSPLDKKFATATPPDAAAAEYKFPAAAVGISVFGIPGWTRQADVLRPLAPLLSARDDTFTIRAYGDARDKSGNITARATCEAIVRRSRDYCDSADSSDLAAPPSQQANKTFGRRFNIMNYRWLSPSEI